MKLSFTLNRKLMPILGWGFILFCTGCTADEESREISKTTVSIVGGEIDLVSGTRKISGVYPHLTTYAHARKSGEYGFGDESGIGALAVWNEKLYMINYGAHLPTGSEHNLYIIDQDKNMQIFEGSIGGTPAARMVHQESNQLLIGPYVIDSDGHVRVIPIRDMKGRLTAIARHLKDPESGPGLTEESKI